MWYGKGLTDALGRGQADSDKPKRHSMAVSER